MNAFEAFGIVQVEAMMCGATVVAADCPTGPRELLQEGKYGYLVPPRDPIAMADGIEAALARIRQSARLLIRNGLHYQEDTARLAAPRLESGEHVILRVENDATAPDGEAQGRAPRE